MAPFPYQPPSPPLIHQPSPIVPSFPLIQTSSFIPRKLFLQLLAGTVGLFILTVLFWKLPGFLRFFTKARVLGGGNNTSTRYAKTWYGWVSAQRHEARKQIFQNCMAKILGWFLWRSSRANYEWVWWDSKQRELGAYQESKKPQMSRWARWYDLAMAEAMYSHINPPSSRPSTNNYHEAVSPPFATGALSPSHDGQSLGAPTRGPTRTSSSLQEYLSAMPLHSAFSYRRRAKMSSLPKIDTSQHTVPCNGKAFTPISKCPFARGPDRPVVSHTKYYPHNFSLPCLSHPKLSPQQPAIRSSGNGSRRRTESEGLVPDMFPALYRSRKYQVWSARMGLQTLNSLEYANHTLGRVPPGSPRSALLGSLSFDSTTLHNAHQHRQGSKLVYSSNVSDPVFDGEHQHGRDRLIPELVCINKTGARKEWHSLPPVCDYRPTRLSWHEDLTRDSQGPARGFGMRSKELRNQTQRRTHRRRTPQFVVQAKDWSNWEVRLIHSLDQKLEWISDQLTPGQRPFHFAILANHWLNRETWIVYDPISRVNIEKRRNWGDPRFNVPYPTPASIPTPKYRSSNHKRAHTPAINSWRNAVNQHRRASGQRPILKAIELYDSSAEDPPDGKIDPACWVLRKPPQGIGLSARQKEEYYEGGAGWQETLNDWQRIRRGYRIRKAIYEGRANRTRVKEIAYGITRCYRQAASRVARHTPYHGEDWGKEFMDEPS